MGSQTAESTSRDLRQLFHSGSAAGLTDGQLLERLAGRRDEMAEAALSTLLGRHGPMVWATCSRVLGDHHAAEDAFQATFLALVRRAGSLRVRESLGPWLHTVATRIALKGRTGKARRQARERRAAVPETVERGGAGVDDLGPAVHEEVTRLPSKYREPIVLCYFEGRTHDETAVTLGWPVGTVRGRLARARDLLRARLTRRGLAPDGVLGAGLMMPKGLATLPSALLDATIGVALRGVAIGPRVAALARHALAGALLDQARLAGTIILAAVLAVGGAFVAGTLLAEEPPAQAGEPTGAKGRTGVPDDAPADPSKPPDPVRVEGIVVDRAGRPLADVELFLGSWYMVAPGERNPALARAVTDEQGHFEMVVPPLSTRRGQPDGPIWAYKPGLAIGGGNYLATRDQEPLRIQLEAPAVQVVTVRRRDGSALPGVKVTPHYAFLPHLRTTRSGELPDELADRLADVSDAEGHVHFPYSPELRRSTTFRVWSGSVGVHTMFTSSRAGGVVDLVAEPAGSLAGIVKRRDGRSPGSLSVVLVTEHGRAVRLEGRPIRVAPDGRFRTPPVLIAGTRYRVIIRGEGVRPVVSPWIDPAGDGRTATLGDLVVESLRQVSGRVLDRQGTPIVGAEVIQAGDGPERTAVKTDVDGRFQLGGYHDEAGLVFARAEGFRFGGQVVSRGENTVILSRVTEAPERAMPSLPPPLPAAELRALSRRVLDPYLEQVFQPDAAAGKYRALEVLLMLDPPAALEKLQGAGLDKQPAAGFTTAADRLRALIATELARTDPDSGTAIARAIADPADRAEALVMIVDVIPGDDKARRIALLEAAVVAARAANRPDRTLWFLGDVGERLVEEGELVKALPLFTEGLNLARAERDLPPWRYFAARLAVVDLTAALKLIDEIPDPAIRSQALANTAVHLAAGQPAEAERLLARASLEDRSRAHFHVVDRMAPVDPVRARRIVGEVSHPFAPGSARIILARALARVSKPEAEKAFREALAELDASPRDVPRIWLTQSLMLPLVEDIDPALVPEYFWRSLALRPPVNGPENATGSSNGTRVESIVARYDRKLAAALRATFDDRRPSVQPRPLGTRWSDDLIARALVDPRAAVAWLESRPKPEQPDYSQSAPRYLLSHLLAVWSVGRTPELLDDVRGVGWDLAHRDMRFR